ncbi:MAG: GDP-mannose 4,6-dehydratase [Candidatus Aenigmarchaeota archaeon]|nr:GDP-mannose 4,6-dehydratase [Candidatus Aenigmarchaeota archaeon]
MAVLVTGGAGFIGSHVVDALLSRGDNVVCIDNLNSYYDPLQKIRNIQHHLDNPKFNFFCRDICERQRMSEIFDVFDIKKVVHLAARAGVRASIEQPHVYTEANVEGTVNMLEVAKKHFVKNFVFASSSSAYGPRAEESFSEETIHNDRPASPYAASKKSCEHFCHMYSKLGNIPVTALRFFSVYGPRGRPDMMPYKTAALISLGQDVHIYGDGTTKRDWTYVEDVVNGVIAALDDPKDYDMFNIGNSHAVELNTLISLLEQNLGKQAKRVYLPAPAGEPSFTHADISKAKKHLGWEPKTSIEEGIARFVDWFKQQRRQPQKGLELDYQTWRFK